MNTPLRLTAIATIMATISACSSNPKINPTPTNRAPFELTASSRGPVLILDDMLFDFEQSTLRPEAQSVVKQTANFLRDNPERIAVIEGHTDHTGDVSYNQMLSLARSTSVRAALLASGVVEHRIQTEGFGETRPVANNNTATGRQANRRVEIIFQRKSELLSSL
jgi:outer membrane protein OmpA-like peptidoglycan-associated protein